MRREGGSPMALDEPAETTVYEERQTPDPVRERVWLLWLALRPWVGAATLAMAAAGVGDGAWEGALVLGILGVVALLAHWSDDGTLTVKVTPSDVVLTAGRWRARKRWPVKSIVHVDVSTFELMWHDPCFPFRSAAATGLWWYERSRSQLAQFSRWGRRAEAVVLTFGGGRQAVVVSQAPMELVEAVRAAAGLAEAEREAPSQT